MNKNKIIIVGSFIEIIELAEDQNYDIVGLVDDKRFEEYKGYPILLNDSDGSVLNSEFLNSKIVITPDLPSVREKLFIRYSSVGFEFENIISQNAKISKSSIIGKGVIINTE